MAYKWSCVRRPISCIGLLLAVLVMTPCAEGGVAGWVRELAAQPVPQYPDDPDVVQLLDEQTTTISKDGEMKTYYRRAYRVIRNGPLHFGQIPVYFDSETRLTYLKAYTVTSSGVEFELKEKDAIESEAYHGGVLFSDERKKVLMMPALDPGSVFGLEYEQRRRPGMYDEDWYFQDIFPVRRARMTVRVPSGWEYRAYWINHAEVAAQSLGDNSWTWELTEVPAIRRERAMPSYRAIASRMLLKYFSPHPELKAKQQGSWDDVARWYGTLVKTQHDASPAIKERAGQLLAGRTMPLEKIRALAEFSQNEIRYVAMYIGIGGYQPHAATDIFVNRYGDCKDKVTLLTSMLQEYGFESYYVLTNTERGTARPEVPVFVFNHAIIAIRLPAGVDAKSLPGAAEVPGLGAVLFFDPTSRLTQFGSLPPYLQDNAGLIVSERGGTFVRMPLATPENNMLRRKAHFRLAPDGVLSGKVEEERSGAVAYEQRGYLIDEPANLRYKWIESSLSSHFRNFSLRSSELANVEDISKDLKASYELTAPKYAQVTGDLLLIRPRVIGQKSFDYLEEKKERKYPVEYEAARIDTDVFEIELPAGYTVDELPTAVHLDSGFAQYESSSTVENGILKYQRKFVVRQVEFPLERLGELKKFLRQVSADEQNSAVLKRTAPQ
jgi:uncharacterized protein DUF3857/transglutaminase superfamily protein